jgi:hypothetical protein
MKLKSVYVKVVFALSLAIIMSGCSSKPTTNDLHSWLQKSFDKKCYKVSGVNILYTEKENKRLYNVKYSYQVTLGHNVTPDDIDVLRRVEVGAGIPQHELNADKKWLNSCLSNASQISLLQNFVNSKNLKKGSVLKMENLTLMAKTSAGWIPKQ